MSTPAPRSAYQAVMNTIPGSADPVEGGPVRLQPRRLLEGAAQVPRLQVLWDDRAPLTRFVRGHVHGAAAGLGGRRPVRVELDDFGVRLIRDVLG